MSTPVSTSLSVHWTSDMHASSTNTSGAPLQLTCRSDNGYVGAEISIYTGDQTLTDRLVESFNAIVKARKDEMQMAEVHSG